MWFEAGVQFDSLYMNIGESVPYIKARQALLKEPSNFQSFIYSEKAVEAWKS
jgi:hypothetical protein